MSNEDSPLSYLQNDDNYNNLKQNQQYENYYQEQYYSNENYYNISEIIEDYSISQIDNIQTGVLLSSSHEEDTSSKQQQQQLQVNNINNEKGRRETNNECKIKLNDEVQDTIASQNVIPQQIQHDIQLESDRNEINNNHIISLSNHKENSNNGEQHNIPYIKEDDARQRGKNELENNQNQPQQDNNHSSDILLNSQLQKIDQSEQLHQQQQQQQCIQPIQPSQITNQEKQNDQMNIIEDNDLQQLSQQGFSENINQIQQEKASCQELLQQHQQINSKQHLVENEINKSGQSQQPEQIKSILIDSVLQQPSIIGNFAQIEQNNFQMIQEISKGSIINFKNSEAESGNKECQLESQFEKGKMEKKKKQVYYTQEQSLLLEKQYYKNHKVLGDDKNAYCKYYQPRQANESSSQYKYVLVVRFCEYIDLGIEYLIRSSGLSQSSKNTNSKDIIVGRQNYFEKIDEASGDKTLYIPNDIIEDTDTDMSRIHCKFVYQHFFNDDDDDDDNTHKMDGNFSYFMNIMKVIIKRRHQFPKNNQQNRNNQFNGNIQLNGNNKLNGSYKLNQQSLYKIANCCQNISIINNLLKRFIVPDPAIYIVDLSSANGTKILVDCSEFTRLYYQQVITVGINTNLLVDQVNDMSYYDKFYNLIAQCVYDQCRLAFEIKYNKLQFEVEDNVFGLGIDEEIAFRSIVEDVINFFTQLVDEDTSKLKLQFFTLAQKKIVLKKIKEFIKEYMRDDESIFKQFRPYLRILVKFDDKQTTVRAYYLFHDYTQPDKVFKIGRLDTNHIQIKYSFISRKNSEIIYKDNHWFIRDGFYDLGKRIPSTEKTWIHLINFNIKMASAQLKDSVSCVMSERSAQVEIGPYQIKSGDTIKCGKQKYQFTYLQDEQYNQLSLLEQQQDVYDKDYIQEED